MQIIQDVYVMMDVFLSKIVQESFYHLQVMYEVEKTEIIPMKHQLQQVVYQEKYWYNVVLLVFMNYKEHISILMIQWHVLLVHLVDHGVLQPLQIILCISNRSDSGIQCGHKWSSSE